jgi:predicted transcriptional regulator
MQFVLGEYMDYLTPLRSELKLKILLSLQEGAKKLSVIKNEVNTRETTILHILKEFEGMDLTSKSEGMYSLTSLGTIEAQFCRGYYSAGSVIENFKDFWLSHDVSVIPTQLMLTIGALQDSNLVKTELEALNKVHENFMQVLLSSKNLKGISPIFHPDYVMALAKLLETDNPIELILTKAVLTKTFASASTEQNELTKKYIQNGKLKLYLNENVKVALTITDSVFSLGLFKLNGEYDYTADLVSFSRDAMQWGEQLFENMLKDSVPVKKEALE